MITVQPPALLQQRQHTAGELAISHLKAFIVLLLVAVLAGCTKTPSVAEQAVSVKRDIFSFQGGTFEGSVGWTLNLDSSPTFVFSRGETQPKSGYEYKVLRFDLAHPEAPASIFETFLKWASTAEQNNVEPFTKEIRPGYVFEFTRELGMIIYAQKTRFDRVDIENFDNLLKQLPEAQAELAAKLAKAKEEAKLFK